MKLGFRVKSEWLEKVKKIIPYFIGRIFLDFFRTGVALERVQWVQLNPWILRTNPIEPKDFMETHTKIALNYHKLGINWVLSPWIKIPDATSVESNDSNRANETHDP